MKAISLPAHLLLLFLVAAVFAVLGSLFMFHGATTGMNQDDLLFGAFFVLVPLGICFLKYRQYRRFSSMSYEWYITTHPHCLNNGKVSCSHCGSGPVHARNLMQQTFHRCHFCTQCGQTLYYSPE